MLVLVLARDEPVGRLLEQPNLHGMNRYSHSIQDCHDGDVIMVLRRLTIKDTL